MYFSDFSNRNTAESNLKKLIMTNKRYILYRNLANKDVTKGEKLFNTVRHERHGLLDFLIRVAVNEQSLFTHVLVPRWPRVRATDRLLEDQKLKKKKKSNARSDLGKTATPHAR